MVYTVDLNCFYRGSAGGWHCCGCELVMPMMMMGLSCDSALNGLVESSSGKVLDFGCYVGEDLMTDMFDVD